MRLSLTDGLGVMEEIAPSVWSSYHLNRTQHAGDTGARRLNLSLSAKGLELIIFSHQLTEHENGDLIGMDGMRWL